MTVDDETRRWRARKQLPRVHDIIAFLQTLPQEAFVCISGQEYCLTDYYEIGDYGEGRGILMVDIRPDLGAPAAFHEALDA